MNRSTPYLALASLFGLSASLLADTAPPVVTEFSISPTSVDITSGIATVQVTLRITDDASGFKESNIYLYNSNNSFVTNFYFNASEVQPGGTHLDGSYVVNVIVPQYGKAGNWRVDGFFLDNDNNRSWYGDGNGGVPLPGPGSDIFTVANSGLTDTEPAAVASISLSPTSVDVSAQSRTVTVTLRVTDALSGLRYGSSYLLKPDSSEFANHYFTPAQAVGTPQDGTYTFDFVIPQGSEAGTWKIGQQLRDMVGNLTLSYNDPNANLTVINTAGPGIGSLRDACDATQYTWNTSGSSLWFAQAATTHDGIDAAQSGPVADNQNSTMSVQVPGPGTLKFWWKVDSASGDALVVFANGPGNSQGISGNSPWQQVSLAIGPGPQTVTWTYSKNAGGSLGQDAGWVDQVQYLADIDNDAPVIQRLAISPNPVSVANGGAEVTATLEISDDNSGFSSGELKIYDANGNYFGNYIFDSADRISGNDSFGTYRVPFSIFQSDLAPAGSHGAGTWHAEISLEDQDSNSRSYPGGDDFPIAGSESFDVSDVSAGPLGIESIDSFVPNPVNITAGSQTLTLTFTMLDPNGGFGYGYVYIFDAANRSLGSKFFDTTSGQGNQYSVQVTVPRYASPGSWRVSFDLYDQANNFTQISGPFQTIGDDRFTVINTAVVDTTPPVLGAVSISPKFVDTTSSGKTIAVTVNLADDISGIQYAYLDFINPSGVIDNSLFAFVEGIDISGGSFTVNRTLPQDSQTGGWRVEVAARDQVGNFRRYGLGPNTTAFPNPADAQFTVGPLTGSSFAAFSASYSLAGNDALLGANPDNDWASNALEFLLGLNPTLPTAADPSLYHVTRVGNELQLDFKPAANLTITENGNFLNVANAAGDAPVRVTAQTATDLNGPWTNTRPLPVGGGFYRAALPVGPGAKGFARLMFLEP